MLNQQYRSRNSTAQLLPETWTDEKGFARFAGRSILPAWDNRNEDVAAALFVDMQRGRSREQPARPVAGIIVQKGTASQ